jgi:2OG-Fe(II) oxygenase superfamily
MNRAYAIADDFLSPQEHSTLWDAFQETIRTPAGTADWNRAYRLMDGDAPVSSAFSARRPSLQDDTVDGSRGPAALRLFSEKLLALMAGERAPISIDPWTGFSQSPWIYRSGAGLEWHSDTGWLGAYIYYLHPLWRSSWGGELLVADGDMPPPDRDGSRRAVEAVCRSGGVFIYPHPNRLVLLRGGTYHCIKKVESAAGDAFRASVSGFFFNTDRSPAPHPVSRTD